MNNESLNIPSAQEYLPALVTGNNERTALQTLVGKALQVAGESRLFAVTDPRTYQDAAERMKTCKQASKQADEFRRTFTDPLNATVKRWNAFFKAPLDMLNIGAEDYEDKLLTYDRAERLREAEARCAAEVVAAAEKQRLQREAERAAKSLEKKGEHEAAAEIRSSVPEVPVIPQHVAPERPAGLSVVTYHKAACADLRALVTAIAAGTAPITLVTADESALNKFAAATKGTIAVPGVRFYIEESTRQRS